MISSKNCVRRVGAKASCDSHVTVNGGETTLGQKVTFSMGFVKHCNLRSQTTAIGISPHEVHPFNLVHSSSIANLFANTVALVRILFPLISCFQNCHLVCVLVTRLTLRQR